MTQEQTSFQAGIEFEAVLQLLSKQIYETPLAFIRENVQNAVDAIRIQAHRENIEPRDSRYSIDVKVEGRNITVCDNGIGMTASDLEDSFWTIGASGKRTAEALAAGCVGTFGIGGYANFGVCETLEVISQTEESEYGTLTRLTKADIEAAGTAGPQVRVEKSQLAQPRGTVVIGQLREDSNLSELRRYLVDFVRFVPVAVYFNNERISQAEFATAEDRENYTEISRGVQEWHHEELSISGRLFEDRGHSLIISLENLRISGDSINLRGLIRFENGAISVFKHGFKLCGVSFGTTIGVSGRLDCDRFAPTAGRDSLDSNTYSLLSRIVSALERLAIETVLETPERVAQHTRIFKYVLRNGMIGRMGNVMVRLADGSERFLKDIRNKSSQSGVRRVLWHCTEASTASNHAGPWPPSNSSLV